MLALLGWKKLVETQDFASLHWKRAGTSPAATIKVVVIIGILL
ncbi:MAG: hypothetical protein AAB110_10150 [Candidatus Desantisbacteria bacterium]